MIPSVVGELREAKQKHQRRVRLGFRDPRCLAVGREIAPILQQAEVATALGLDILGLAAKDQVLDLSSTVAR